MEIAKETLKQIVGLCKITPSDCGIVPLGSYLAHIRHDIITDRCTLVLEELPQYCTMLQGDHLEIVCRLLREKIPVIALVEPGETRTGLHWVKLEGSHDVLLLEQIAPEQFIANPIVTWTQDTPHGKVIYSASGYVITILYDKQADIYGIPIIRTVFRSTLEKLTNEGKATKDDDGYAVSYTITDQEIAKKIIESGIQYSIDENNRPVVIKHNVPKRIFDRTIVIPLP